MKLSVNGQEFETAEQCSGAELMEQLEITTATVVVEYNGAIMQRDRFLDQQLADGDSIELVTLVGGG